MNGIETLLLIVNIKTVFFVILAFLVTNLLMERKTYTSSYIKKIRMLQIGAIFVSLAIVSIMTLLMKMHYLSMVESFFGIVNITRYQVEVLLFSAISFEFLYDFVLSKEKLNFPNVQPYIILYGYPLLMDILIMNMDLGILSFITNILYIYYLYDYVNNKTNTIIM